MQSNYSSGQVADEFVSRLSPKIEGSISYPYVAKTAAYVITDLDYTIHCTANTFNVTLPTAVGTIGRVYVIKNTGAGTITLDTTGGQFIDGVLTATVNSSGGFIVVQSTGANWVVTSSGGYHPDAQAYFDLVGDIPTFWKDAWNAFVIAEIANGTWSTMKMALVLPYTQSRTEVMRDAKTLLITATLSPVVATPFITKAFYGSNAGMSFDTNGIIKTTFIPSANLTLNSTCVTALFPSPTTAKAAYSIGCFQDATHTMTFIRRDAGSSMTADAYSTTVGTGRVSQVGTADGALGYYIMNRQSSTDFKLRKNGVTIASSVLTAGTLPNVEIVVNNLS